MSSTRQSQYSKTAIKALNADSASYAITASHALNSGGSPITIKDEGNTLTTEVTSIDFIGTGVTATNIGNAVTVTIPGSGGSVDTGSFVTTSSFNAFTSSINSFTSSYNTGSFNGSFTGSLLGTSSYATQALSASWAPSSPSNSQYILVNTTDGTPTTSTSISGSYSVEIPANTFADGDIIHLFYRASKNPTTANCDMGIYVNTSNTLTGATLIGFYRGNARSYTFIRYLMLRSGNTQVYPVSLTNLTQDLTNPSTTVFSNLSIDWTTTQYIIFTSILGSALDTFTANGYMIERKRTSI